MRTGVIAPGLSELRARAKGIMKALLRREPLVTAQTTGSSLADENPESCSAVRARSSPTTPTVFWAASLASTVTSSRTVVMSSRRARSEKPAKLTPPWAAQ
jgi:hypothetical protein